MPIKILPKETVSLIAAGEVIESPASVLKELIENSLDAGAKTLDIELQEAGKKLIRVKDDGFGMPVSDLKLSIYPHSTSKISSYDDLNRISTYGFRGEALYSAFCVSKMSITSFDENTKEANTLSGEAGDFKNAQIKPAPPLKGTAIEIRDLFFNTPARKKFLKSDNSLKSSAIRVIEEFILSNPEVSFSLKIDSREVFSVKTGRQDKTLLTKMKEVLMPKTAEKLIELNSQTEEFSLNGYISDPSNLISSRHSQYLFVNRRSVENKTLNQAVYKAYEHIRNGRHPAFAIFLTVKADKVDVNVHPQKKEVKFSDESKLYDFAVKTLTETLNKLQTPPSMLKQPDVQSYQLENGSLKPGFAQASETLPQYAQEDFLNHIYSQEAPLWYKPPIVFIGQIFNSFLIYQTADSLLLMDQHAAVERILFEKYLEEFKTQSIQVQELLIPAAIELPASDLERLLKWKDWLAKAGFDINQSGPKTITAYSSPAIFYFTPQALNNFFLYLADVLGEPEKAPEELKRRSIATIACKKSVKAHDKIDGTSAMKIIDDLKKCEDPLHCPHGRPTLIETSLDELIRRFGRNSL